MKELYFENPAIISGINYNDPTYDIRETEFDQAIVKFGSYISILKNKRINQTTIILEILKNKHYLKALMELTDIDNERVLIYNFIKRYPIICNSKIIQNKLTKIVHDRSRKKSL